MLYAEWVWCDWAGGHLQMLLKNLLSRLVWKGFSQQGEAGMMSLVPQAPAHFCPPNCGFFVLPFFRRFQHFQHSCLWVETRVHSCSGTWREKADTKVLLHVLGCGGPWWWWWWSRRSKESCFFTGSPSTNCSHTLTVTFLSPAAASWSPCLWASGHKRGQCLMIVAAIHGSRMFMQLTLWKQ